MQELTVRNSNQLQTLQAFDTASFYRWTSFIDASRKTIDTYNRAIKQFAFYLASKGIINPTREDILNYREELKATKKPTTVQLYLASVKLFFQWTAQEGKYPNIAEHIKGAKLDTDHKKDYLTSKQAAKLLRTIDRSTLSGKRDYAMLSLMATTGLRTISITKANVEDIRPAGDAMALYYQGKGHEEKAVYVKLAEPVEEAIREYLNARGTVSAKAPLFASHAHRNGGERLTTRSVSRVAKEHLIEAGLNSERWTAHSLRHTAATLNLQAGASIEETKQLLDHKNINTTLIYSHALERAKNKSEERIAKVIFG